MGDTPEPPKTWRERPGGWPVKVPYNGIHPNRDLYPRHEDDPAYAHLRGPGQSHATRGKIVYRRGMSPLSWHPDWRNPRMGKIHEKMRAQADMPHDDPTEGGTPEERVESFRALSRAYASVPEATLRKIIKSIAEDAAHGDKDARTLFVRLEQLQASKPVSTEGVVIAPETVVLAERCLDDLIKKINAVYPDESCPWCGQNVP